MGCEVIKVVGSFTHDTAIFVFICKGNDGFVSTVQIIWASGSSFEILMAYLIIPRAGWRILVLVSALPMVLTFFSAMVCTYQFYLTHF